ncbi:MAG: helix-turn-helix domain-containing protein, partial [Pseudomonadota bacterium]
CQVMGITRADLEGKRRFKSVIRARNIGMYLSRVMTSKSYPQIGIAYGGRHHTTVLHAFNKVEELLPEASDWSDDVARVKAVLNQLLARPAS